MHILIDAMGGDNAPEEIVRGAVTAMEAYLVDITLIGRETVLRPLLDEYNADKDHIHIVNADEVVTMEDDPATAVRRKKNSSMAVMLRMLADGEGDACVSAGSTGALLSGATLTVKRVRGIRRACFAPVIPNGDKGVVLADCGANSECTAEYLLQFAYMGSFYAKTMLGSESPRVGLLNIGAEESKGTELQKAANELLKAADAEGRIRYVGNVESSELFSDRVDVLVSDGFTGNILLKSIEGTARFLMKQLKNVFYHSTKNKLAALLVKEDMQGLKSLLDAGEVGGTPLLGISKPVIKAHGSSDARAIRSAIRQAIQYADSGMITLIERNIDAMRLDTKEA